MPRSDTTMQFAIGVIKALAALSPLLMLTLAIMYLLYGCESHDANCALAMLLLAKWIWLAYTLLICGMCIVLIFWLDGHRLSQKLGTSVTLLSVTVGSLVTLM